MTPDDERLRELAPLATAGPGKIACHQCGYIGGPQ